MVITGGGRIYHIDKAYISVAQHVDYSFRGDELKDYCLYEYVCIIKIVPKPQKKKKRRRNYTCANENSNVTEHTLDDVQEQVSEDDEDSVPDVQVNNMRFDFDCRHPLYSSHHQMIQSVFKCPILAGASPPRLPVPKSFSNDQWNRQGNDFAYYYLTLFVPWDIQRLVPSEVPFNYNGFKQWTSTFKNRESSFIDKCKYAAINNISSSMHIAAEKKTLLTKWRGRAATRWSSTNEEVPSRKADGNDLEYDDDDDGNDNVLDDDAIDDIVTALLHQCNGNDTTEYQCFQEESLSSIYSQTLESITSTTPMEQTDTDANVAPQQNYINIQNPAMIKEMFNALNSSDDADNDGDEQKESTIRDDEFMAIPLDISPDERLGRDQNRALVKVLSHVHDVITGQLSESTPLNLIIHGGPGVGKSTYARVLVQRLHAANLTIQSAAPTGMAASILIGGRTLHVLFKLPVKTKKGGNKNTHLPPLNDKAVLILRKLFDGCFVLLIDEMSMADAVTLSHIDSRLRQILDTPTVPFGGLTIILMGDFFQLPPVGGKPLFYYAVNPIKASDYGTPLDVGSQLFNNFEMISLSDQYRSEDPIHTALIQKLRNTTLRNPIDDDVIDSLKVLTSEDVDEDNSWLSAPIVVCSNKERHALNLSQARRFAIRNGVPILRWKNDLTASASSLDDIAIDLLYENEPELTGLFVKGAPGLLSRNMNPIAGLANGTPIVLHSITLCPDDDPEGFREIIRNASPGEFIDIPPPLSVNVMVPAIDATEWNEQHTLVSGQVVIPLISQSHQKNKIEFGNNGTEIRYKTYMHELGFALTFHKIQGQTVDRIILDLNNRPKQLGKLNFFGFYVGISRVRLGKHLRILPPQPHASFSHLRSLNPDACLQEWLKRVDTAI
jgi:DNA polymerase III delta prime subunit